MLIKEEPQWMGSGDTSFLIHPEFSSIGMLKLIIIKIDVYTYFNYFDISC